MKLNLKLKFKNEEELKICEDMINKGGVTKDVIRQVAQSGFNEGVKYTCFSFVSTVVFTNVTNLLYQKIKGEK